MKIDCFSCPAHGRPSMGVGPRAHLRVTAAAAGGTQRPVPASVRGLRVPPANQPCGRWDSAARRPSFTPPPPPAAAARKAKGGSETVGRHVLDMVKVSAPPPPAPRPPPATHTPASRAWSRSAKGADPPPLPASFVFGGAASGIARGVLLLLLLRRRRRRRRRVGEWGAELHILTSKAAGGLRGGPPPCRSICMAAALHGRRRRGG